MSTVQMTQYLRPTGRPKIVYVDLPDEVARHATDMELSCEVLMDGEVVIYARYSDQDEEEELMEFATNEPGPEQPDRVTAKLVERLWSERH